MAQRIAKPCATSGCRGIAANSRFCEDCRSSGRAREFRPSAAARGYDWKWRNYRVRFLKLNPFCVDPFEIHYKREEFNVVATRVDHKIPHAGNEELFWRESNHQALCEVCHNFKTAKFDGGFGRLKKECFVNL